MSFGMKVEITFDPESVFAKQNIQKATLRNVTEIHFNPSHSDDFLDIIAFESDIHHTGITYVIGDIAEYEATLEDIKADAF